MSLLVATRIWICSSDMTLFSILLPIIFHLPSFSNPSIITGDDYRPDILILTKDNTLYVLELTVGYETNLRNNFNHKYSKYKELIKELKRKFNCVKFINLSVSALVVFDNESAA